VVNRPSQTRVPIHPDLAARWSPRLFDVDAVLKADDLVAVLEAARWAATGSHWKRWPMSGGGANRCG